MSAGAAQGPAACRLRNSTICNRADPHLSPASGAGDGLIRGAAQAANSLNLRKRPMIAPAFDDCAQ